MGFYYQLRTRVQPSIEKRCATGSGETITTIQIADKIGLEVYGNAMNLVATVTIIWILMARITQLLQVKAQSISPAITRAILCTAKAIRAAIGGRGIATLLVALIVAAIVMAVIVPEVVLMAVIQLVGPKPGAILLVLQVAMLLAVMLVVGLVALILLAMAK